jgi:Flp pilus assembly protein TadG
MVVLFAVALLVVAGVVIDTGYALSSKRAALNHAEQAARAGADALDVDRMRDDHVQVNPTAARAAAQTYLQQVGATGAVTVNGGEVTVTVTGAQQTTILTVIGIGDIPYTATATAVSIGQGAGP